MSKTVVAWDTETFPIGLVPENTKRPKTNRNPVPRMVCMTYSIDGRSAKLVRGKEAVKLWLGWLTRHDVKLVGANVAFDMLVMARAAMELMGVDALPTIFEAYEDNSVFADGRIHDVQIREQLVDIAIAGLKDSGYNLSKLVKRHLGLDISASKSGDDVWRLRYNELHKYDTEHWPEAAVAYAKDDAKLTWQVYESQRRVTYSTYGTIVAGENGVENEQFQVMAAFALHLMTTWGLRVDLAFTEQLDAQYAARADELSKPLKEWGILRPSGSENQDETRRLYAKAFAEVGLDPVMTDGGKISTGEKSRTALTDAGYSNPKFDVLQEYKRAEKFRTTYLEPAMMAWPYSMCPRFSALVGSGRTSSSGPNIQNFPKHSKKIDTLDASDVRRCFIPRDGNVFVNADYSTLELRTLAQVNLNLGVAHVHMAEALQEGRDLHTDFAAQLLGLDYQTAINALSIEGHELFKKVNKNRKVAKVANFGFPGGLGPAALVTYARGSYGVKIAPDEAVRLRDHWMNRWSEMAAYFDYINECQRYDGVVAIKQHAPFRNQSNWRTRHCDRYTSACNTLFQGMAADGCKTALWMLAKGCYIDESSPLHGFRLNAFIHDEFLLEGPEHRASEAADELVRIMQDGMAKFTPDIPILAEPALGRRWDVNMASKRDTHGRWSVYESQEAA